MYGMPATMPPPGGYMLLLKWMVMLVLLLPWMWAAPWVQRDLAKFRGAGKHWGIAALAAGVVGILLWLFVPFYLAGIAMYLALTGGVIGAYVAWRNARVAPDEKVGTAEHLQSIFHRKPRAEVTVQPVHRVTVYDSAERLVVPEEGNREAVVDFNNAQELLSDIIASRASQAEIAASPKAVTVRLVIDGDVVNRSAMPMSPYAGEAVIQYLKGIAGMNVEDRRRPQTGTISADLAGKRVDLKLAAAGTTSGQRMQLSVAQEMVRTSLEELGMSRSVLDRVVAFTQSDRGLLIVSGRPRSGITSTMYSVLRRYDAFLHQLVTLESRAAIDLENITQNQYGNQQEEAIALASALRLGPDVLMVDRCPDTQSAQLIMKAASGMPVILGVHASSTFVALAKWVKLCGDAESAVKDLQVVLYQLLAGRLCPDCRESYRPDPQLLAKANLTGMNIEKFYRPPTGSMTDESGNPITCRTCNGSGYFGRVGVFEMLEMNDQIRQLVVSGAPLSQIKAACRKNKMLYLQEQALRKVVEGVTGVKEVIRVTQESNKDA